MTVKKKKLKKSAIAFITVLVLVIVGTIGFFVNRAGRIESPAEPTIVATVEPTATPEPPLELAFEDDEVLALYDEYLADHAINSEVVGILHFKDDWIHEPVAQSSDNEKYLRLNWENGEYRSYGTAFLDFRNQLDFDEQNTIIYGHYIYEAANRDRTLMFTPLRELRTEGIETHKDLVFVTENDVRYYELYAVYDCPLIHMDGYDITVPELQYNLIEYDEEYFASYIQEMRNVALFIQDEELTMDDRTLVLQTCIEGNEDARQIVVCKLIAQRTIEEVING